jgi:hypothetical protein
MTRTSVLSLRPALALAIAVAAIALLFVGSYHQAEAGSSNQLSIDPASKDIGVGASASVNLVSMAPTESLAAWVVNVSFDETVVGFNSCTAIGSPAGAVAVSFCDELDTGGGPDSDTAVAGGAILFPTTERGLDGTNTLATITFDAIGTVGECSDLTITVIDHLGPDPNASNTNPTTIDGEICIVEDAGTDRLWGDIDCGDSVDPIDSLKILRFDAGLSVAQAAGCPEAGSTTSVDGTDRLWGDLDCGDSVDPIDSLKTLRFDAGLSVSQSAGCPDPASTVSVS